MVRSCHISFRRRGSVPVGRNVQCFTKSCQKLCLDVFVDFEQRSFSKWSETFPNRFLHSKNRKKHRLHQQISRISVRCFARLSASVYCILELLHLKSFTCKFYCNMELKSYTGKVFRSSVCKRLLHPGASTSEILDM